MKCFMYVSYFIFCNMSREIFSLNYYYYQNYFNVFKIVTKIKMDFR